MAKPSSTSVWMAIRTGSIAPSASSRVNATPWKSGVSQAIHSMASGSCSMGKNVPEKRKSGVMMKRKMNANDCSVLR